MYKAMLHCGHLRYDKIAPPDYGEIVYCRTCNEYSQVIYQSTDWRISCVDCRYSRYCGADKDWASRRATKHVQLYPTHRIKMFRANNPETWDLVRLDQEPLPIDIDAPF